ncbi:hypothetical protein GYMLUDRAFT_678444 [Collybiopsis luxurians FD-317 M1]|uniref:Uncharacterized protein n=1 Tax=Collybiopsis luxurians FD-317 M1 TaxID=944289 RepID=A0A0D0CLE4_9AGAR|nr:hypothetical protein GYMLUDRAFT_678444 [Collybiopsis luxurians FD-317 M1]
MAETTMATQIFPNASHFGIRDSVFINNTSTLTSDPTHQIASHPPPIPPNSLPNSDVSSEWEDDQFPSRLVESEVYARLLLPRRKGYPLWKPKPDEYLSEEYRRVGVDIGDVGYLNESGGFDYLFNACLPANHPVNLGRVPLDFQPLHGMLNPRDLTGSMREHEPGSHIPSHPSHICKTRKCISCTIPRVPHQMGAGFNFSSSTSKGALLILPEGGRKTDHQQLNTFRDYAAKHARSWYAHANGPLARSIPNGSIYFVTGCDKARAWGTACFIDAQPGDVSLEYVPAESTKRGGLPEYWFSTSNSALSLSGTDDVFENQSGCVFLRGFKVAIKIPPFRTAVAVETTVTDISFLEADDLLPKPKSTGFAISPAPSWWLKPYLVPRTPPPDVVSQEHVVPPELNGNEVDYSSSIRGSVYHPSDTINQWILSQNEEVDVSITHDNDWISVIEDGEEMPDDREIIRRIAKNFEVAKCGHRSSNYFYCFPSCPSSLGFANKSFHPPPLC